jgi:hypothetical protein
MAQAQGGGPGGPSGEEAVAAVKNPAFSHANLVKVAARWLRGTQRCGVVTWEHSGCSRETPDAIGWRHDALVSYLVECKTSRSDFLADADKFYRQYPDQGSGRYRYYLCPEDLLSPADMPDRWGLLWTNGWRVSVKREAQQFEVYNRNHETAMLYHALRRHMTNIDVINEFFTKAFPFRGSTNDSPDTEIQELPGAT